MEMYNVHITLNCTIDSLTQSLSLSLSRCDRQEHWHDTLPLPSLLFRKQGKGKRSRMQWLLISNRAMTDDQQDLS